MKIGGPSRSIENQGKGKTTLGPGQESKRDRNCGKMTMVPKGFMENASPLLASD